MDAARHSISADQALHKGEVIFSPSGQYKAVYENTGDFVLYGWNRLWATNTSSFNGDSITLNKNTTLSIHRDGSQVWTTGTPNPDSPKVRLNVTDTGFVTITELGKLMWKHP